MAHVEARSSLVDLIWTMQYDDPRLCSIRDLVLSGEAKEARLDMDGILRVGSRLCVPKVGDVVRLILEEAHCSRYSIHPGVTKMYRNLSQIY